MTGRSVAFIANETEAGQQLMRGARLLAEEVGYTFVSYIMPSQVTAAKAMAHDDVTILDATINPTGGSAYRAFTAQPFVTDYILVVSRSPLPLNFHGRRSGGAPGRLKTFGNHEILRWLEIQLSDLADRPRRTNFQRTMLGSSMQIFNLKSLASASSPQRHQAFVSYRREALGQAEKLAEDLERGRFSQTGGPADVTFLRPGELAFDDEILTAQLRWHMVALLSEKIASCKSIWICDSPNYLGSWWTRVELILYRYFLFGGSADRIRLFKYEADTGVVSEPADLVPEISYQQKRQIDRIISNTGSTMPADTVARSREIGAYPLFRKSSFWNDPVFSADFANTPLLDTGVATPGTSQLSGSEVQATIGLSDKRLVAVPRDILDRTANDGEVDFEGFRIYRDNSQIVRYLWYPIRLGRSTAPPGSIDDTLAPLPIFRYEG